MRIYDTKTKQSFKRILIMLTPFEVQVLMGTLESLSIENDHIHVMDEEFKRELTIGLYTDDNLYNFSKEVIRLIQEDK